MSKNHARAMTVSGLMRQAARYNANKIAVIQGSRSLTFSEAFDRGVRLANGLLAKGFAPGDRIAVLEDNSLESQAMFLGAALAGLVRVPLYARNAMPSHFHMVSHTGCKGMVVSSQYESEGRSLIDQVSGMDLFLCRDGDYEAWLLGQSPVDPEIVVAESDWFIIRHTGGTTGKPKGVAYSHRTWLDAGRDWFYNFPPMDPDDVCLHVGPISHGSGYLYTPTWLAGCANHLMSEFDPEAVLRAMAEGRGSFMFMVPSMLNQIVRHPLAKILTYPALKVIQIGGAPIADETALMGREVFGDVLYQGFGQTEAVPVCMMGPSEWFSTVEGSEPLRSAGRVLPYAYLEIRDQDKPERELPLGDEGEIAVRCDGQMLGFWDNDEATVERMTSDGFVLTGDIGRIDSNGYLYVLDRKDDMIISGGFNIWPAELENVILDYPGVEEVAVFAAPSEQWGESPVAVCVVVDPSQFEAEAIIEQCKTRLGSYKKPSQVIFQESPLPKSPVGKVQRKVLREQFWGNGARRVAGS